MLWKLAEFVVEHLSYLSNAKILDIQGSDFFRKCDASTSLAASSSSVISLSFFEGKYIASVLDLLPLEEGAALVPTCIRRPNRWK